MDLCRQTGDPVMNEYIGFACVLQIMQAFLLVAVLGTGIEHAGIQVSLKMKLRVYAMFLLLPVATFLTLAIGITFG